MLDNLGWLYDHMSWGMAAQQRHRRMPRDGAKARKTVRMALAKKWPESRKR